MTLPKQSLLDVLELMYAYSQAMDGEKHEALAALNARLDALAENTPHTRQQIGDYLRSFHFPGYYRTRKRQERAEL